MLAREGERSGEPFHAITSYNQVLSIAVNVDSTLVPDPWFYAEPRDAAERTAAATGASGPAAVAASAR